MAVQSSVRSGRIAGMSWNISAAGTPERARASVKGAFIPADQPEGEVAREAIRALLDGMPEQSNVSVSAYGHHDQRRGNVHITVAYSPIDPAPPAGT